jgi:hypothetical protein
LVTQLMAWAIATVLAGLAAIHVYWAAGGRRGILAAIPEVDGAPLFRPGAGVTLMVAVLLLAAGFLVLERGGTGVHLLPPTIAQWGTWMVAFAFVGRSIGDFRYVGFFKRRRTTRFARLDTRLYSPLTLALGAGAAFVAWRGG